MSCTIARNDKPPRMPFRLSVKFQSAGAGVTFNTEVLVVPLYTAEIVAEVVAVTADVAIANVAVLAPCATETVAEARWRCSRSTAKPSRHRWVRAR